MLSDAFGYNKLIGPPQQYVSLPLCEGIITLEVLEGFDHKFPNLIII